MVDYYDDKGPKQLQRIPLMGELTSSVPVGTGRRSENLQDVVMKFHDVENIRNYLFLL